MPVEKIEELIEIEKRETLERRKKYKEDYKIKVKRYEMMKEKINNWNPPTEDHRHLKVFMFEQINLSWPSSYENLYQHKTISVEEWRENKIK